MKNILISGGGVAGAGLACSLSKLVDSSEVAITVLEKELEDDLGKVRKGEVLRPEATKVISESNLMDYVMRERPVVRYSPRPEIWHIQKGKMGSIDYAFLAPEFPMIYLPHKQIVKSLHERMKELGINVIYGVESESAGYDENKRPVVNFRKRSSKQENDSSKISSDLLIIADGATSKIRDSMGFSVELYDYQSTYLMVIIDKPRELDWGRHYLGESSFLGLFSLPNDLMRAAIEVKTKDIGKWLSLSKEQLKRRMVEIAPVVAKSEIRTVGGFYHVIRRQAKRYVSNRVALIGDAAHTTHPQLAQGMSMVFYDVSSLSKLILSNPESNFDESELTAYENLARPHDGEMIINAHDLTEAFEAIGKDPNLINRYGELLGRVGFTKET